MMRNTIFNCLTVAVIITCSQSAVAKRTNPNQVDPSCVVGTWILRLPDERIASQTLTIGPLLQTGHFTVSAPLTSDTTLGGQFPHATFDGTGPSRGSATKIIRRNASTLSAESRAISYAVNMIKEVPSEIAYIQIDEAKIKFPDCQTQVFKLTTSFFLPEQDEDGDGIPDEGQEPFLIIPDQLGTGKKFYPISLKR